MSPIRSVAVLGAGTMGAQIAAHIANAGVPVLLLDLTADAARQGIERARRLKPDPAFTADTWALVTAGGFDTDLARVAECDWIIEAVVEQIEIKQALLARVDEARRPGSAVTSNTSGISIAALAQARSDDFRRHWFGTHFFNPPRHLHLLEVIPAAETEHAVVSRISRFCDVQLGKGVIVAKDSPGFIGNHVGLYGLARMLERVSAGLCTIEEADAITGQAIGRPKSATFRTMDLAGLDIVSHVVADFQRRLPDPHAQRVFVLPPFVQTLVERGAIGEKAGRGFYRRSRRPDGSSEIEVLDIGTLEYRALRTPRLATLDAARAIEDVSVRVRTLFNGRDAVGAFLRATLAPTLVYAARITGGIADSIDDVDRAMRWGFGWELGPYELMDAIGVREVVDAAAEADPDVLAGGVPGPMQTLLDSGRNRFRDGLVPPAAPDLQILRSARDRSAVIATNPGASLVDLGDGAIAVEFHSKMNALGADAMAMLQRGVAEAEAHFAALVVGNDAPNFSAGANLMLLLLEAQEENWDEIDLMIRTFQHTTMALRHAAVPVVMAPAGLALGGGAEITLHGHRVQAAAESYIGLVEAGVGLIPAGGGTKEMLARAVEAAPPGVDRLPYVQRAFETIAFGKVSTSAADARRLGFLSPADGVTMNRERLMADAKAAALAAAHRGYQATLPRQCIAVGGDTVYAPLALGVHLAWRAGRISDHDAVIGRALATIMAGGRGPHATTVSDAHLLDLEREAFLRLLSEPKTQARIHHMLTTGKALRN